MLEKQREEERLRKETEGEELKNFREYVRVARQSYLNLIYLRRAVAARENAAKPPPVPEAAPPVPKAKTTSAAPTVKKDSKKSLKGVLVKKKTKPAGNAKATPSTIAKTASSEKSPEKSKPEEDEPRQTKRRKLAEPES